MGIEDATAWCEKMEELLSLKTAELKTLSKEITRVELLLEGECPEGVDAEKWDELASTLTELKKDVKPKKKNQTAILFTEAQITNWTEFIDEVKVATGVVKVDSICDIITAYYEISTNSLDPESDKWTEIESHSLFDKYSEDDPVCTASEIVFASQLIAKATEIAGEFRSEQSITVKVKSLVYGQPLSAIGATSDGGGKLEYSVEGEDVDENKILNAISRAYSVVIKAEGTDKYKPCERSIEITVSKATTSVDWPRPLPVLKGSLLKASTLNAKVRVSSGKAIDPPPSIAYKPPLGTAVTSKTKELNATFSGTSNYEPSKAAVELQVVDSLAELGKQAMMDGRAMKEPTETSHRELLEKWKTDDSETGLRKQSQKVMSDIKGMTGDELVQYMTEYLKSPGGTGGKHVEQNKGASNENQIWYFPNGMQVRYKPKNPAKAPLPGYEPMFCVEGTTGTGTAQPIKEQAVFKLTLIGEPGAYGPKQTIIPDGVPSDKNEAENQEYMDAACSTTHLFCTPKVEQKITWTNPPSIIVGQPLGEASLKPEADDTASLAFSDDSGKKVTKDTILKAGTHKLRVKGIETPRYLASTASVEVEIVVKKKDQTLDWKPKTVELEVGTPLGDGVLNATATSSLQPVYRHESTIVTKTTKLAAKSYTLKAVVEETAEYNRSNEVESYITIVKKKQTLKWEPKQTSIESDTELGDLLNATTSSGIAVVYTNADATVTKTTKLPPNTYELKAVAPENTEYLASNSETIQITVKEKD